jgi:hypothetical protein
MFSPPGAAVWQKKSPMASRTGRIIDRRPC